MPSLNLLAVFNPSKYWRGGNITIPWQGIAQEFQISPEELLLSDLRDLSHTPIPAQVDRVDPDDPSRAVNQRDLMLRLGILGMKQSTSL